MTKLVFIGGVHGVGKTTFCKSLAAKTGYQHITASQLLKEQKASAVSPTKEVVDVVDNQKLLLSALTRKRKMGRTLLLDGHFTLITPTGDVQKIDKQVFYDIAPNTIIILHDSPKAIAMRLFQRDQVTASLDTITRRQALEIAHGKSIAQFLGIPIYELTPTADSLEYIDKTIANLQN